MIRESIRKYKCKQCFKFNRLTESNSQIGQESFVLGVLDEVKGGFYVEIGACEARQISNTYTLETLFSWKGISLEIDEKKSFAFNEQRRNKCLTLDATTCDYSRVFMEAGAPAIIDYLQVDIEPPINTYKALMKALKAGRTFRVITFEHDIYASRRNLIWKNLTWIKLKTLGYRRVATNVSNERAPMEDWYVHQSVLVPGKLKRGLDWRCYFRGPCSHYLDRALS